jgi:hypothetical protein
MGHSISGFVAREEVLRARTAHLRSAYVAPLAQGFGFLPVTDEVDQETGGRAAAYEQFYSLTDALARLGAAMSRGGAVAYVETEYFGGTGDQAAIAWKDGRIVLWPERARIGTVSDALRRIGAVKDDAHDEFEAVGLDRHRGNDDWIQQAMADAPPGDAERRARIVGAAAPGDAKRDSGEIEVDESHDRSTPFDRTHRVAGFVARMEVLRRGTEGMEDAWIARLADGLGFLPATDELATEVGGDGGRAYDEMDRLTDGLARLGARMSAMDGVIYVETDYHAGVGEQAAMAWHDGDVVWAPIRSRDNAIDLVLGWVGAEVGDHYDEIEALGLDRHRHNDGWVRQARTEAADGADAGA